MTHELSPWIDWVPYVDVWGGPAAKRDFDHSNQLWYTGIMRIMMITSEKHMMWMIHSESWQLRIRLTTSEQYNQLCSSKEFSNGSFLVGYVFLQITFVLFVLQINDLHHLAARLRCHAWFLIAVDWFLIQSATDIRGKIYSMQLTYNISCPNISLLSSKHHFHISWLS